MSYTNKVLMVRPVAFGFNPQTAESNVFQKEIGLSNEEIQAKALLEFNRMANALVANGVEVVIVEDTDEYHTPDSIFPNNWFSTHPDGTVCFYPMEAEVRRFERKLAESDEFRQNIRPLKTIDLTGYEKESKFLEGTGSLILDHENRIAYACTSSRTNSEVLEKWAREFEFETVEFTAVDSEGQPIYHTNVMMCLGDKFAVVCLESVIDEAERLNVTKSLKDSGKEIIEISFQQMYNFAGNMIMLRDHGGENLLVMSKRAFDSLDDAQVKRLESYAKLLPFAIETIEDCGGGSARCMIAEIF